MPEPPPRSTPNLRESVRSNAPRHEGAPFTAEWWAAGVGFMAIIMVSLAGDLALFFYFLCCIAVFARHMRASSTTFIHFLPLLAIPAFALFSSQWSDAPDITKKQAGEFLLFFGTAIVLFRRIRLVDMAAAVQLGTLACCLLSLAMQPSALHGSSLHGFMGSKNQLSFIAQILLISSPAVLFNSELPRWMRLLAIPSFALAALEIHLARSAGGLISSVLAMGVFGGLLLISRLRLSQRLAFIIGGLIAISPLIFVVKDVVDQVQDFQLHVLHKDATLTGRTEIWSFAQSLIAERPVLGHGFAAFWRQGNSDAEAIWQRFHIVSRTGFNFHNEFIETLVGLGFVGLSLFIVTLASVIGPAIVRSVRQPTLGNIWALTTLSALYLKLPLESILLGIWNPYTALFIVAALNVLGGELKSRDALGRHVAEPRTGASAAPSVAASRPRLRWKSA